MDTPLEDSPKLLIASLLLAAMFGLAVGSSLDKSPTFDEGFYIGRGHAYLREGRLFELGHPPLTNILTGLGLLLEPGLPAPQSLDGWETGNPETYSEDLLWRSGVNVERITFLGRLPMVWLGLLMGAVLHRWARDLHGSGALTLVLFAFSPSVLAHTRLATTDIGVAAFYVAALWGWSRYLRHRSPRWLAITGVFFGCAQAAKFSALLLLPTLGLLAITMAVREGLPKRFTLRHPVVGVFAMGLVGVGVLWVVHGLRPSLYFSELLHFFELASGGHRGYLMGRFSEGGWWYYHLIALGAKLTEPALLLIIAAGIIALVGHPLRPQEWTLLFPALFYIGVTLLISLNVGVRYLLPAIALLFVFAGRVTRLKLPLRTTAGGLAALHALFAVLAYPHYIAYFNLIAGGPQNAPSLLVDSNVDWGQDLPLLADYLAKNDIERVHLSYFGQSDPAYYGIVHDPLPAWPPPTAEPDFAPLHPEPGMYAISASNLVGVQLFDHDAFGYFRARAPDARIGYSILIYEVPPSPAPQLLLQCADQAVFPAERAAELTGGHSVTLGYIDCERSAAAPAWLALPVGTDLPFDAGPPDFLGRTEGGSPAYRIWHLDQPDEGTHDEAAGMLSLLTAEWSASSAAPGDTLVLRVQWRVEQVPAEAVSLFAHLIAEDGFVRTTADALGIPLELWQPGMVITQEHHFTLPEGTPPGEHRFAVGLYSLESGERYPVRGAQPEQRQIIVGALLVE